MPSPSPSANDLLTQLTTGPSLREVAATTLRSGLRELYPDLDIDPSLAMLVTPNWQISGELILPATPDFQSLSGALYRSTKSGTPVTWFDGEHFLVYQSITGPDVHLPVKVDAIGRLINELAPLLLVAYQEQQLAFWNQSVNHSAPRWRNLANALRAVWNVQSVEGWDEEECAVARAVFHYPDYAQRLPHDKYGTKVYLIDVDVQRGAQLQHLSLSALAVLVGRYESRDIILSYSIVDGYASFKTLQALGDALSIQVDATQLAAVHWRLFEPSGDIFEQQACCFIAMQIQAIGEISFQDGKLASTVGQVSASGEVDPFELMNTERVEWVRHALPTWIADALPSDQSAYGRYMMNLAALHLQDAGKTFNEGIKPIHEFALDTLHTLMLTDHPRVARSTLDKLRITVTSVQAWGTLVVPGNTQTQTFTLAELALENLIALPLGNKVVSAENGSVVSDWMTPAYLEQLIDQANVGKQYPALVKRTLLDNPTESSRRQTLYTNQLRVQLPLLALQYKVRQVYGLTEQGYRYVCAAMSADSTEHVVDGTPIVIRKLSLLPKRRLIGGADVVDNMFVIGPQDVKKGPCLLYRPLCREPLMEFPSPANLLYALKQHSSLRHSVLAWLPDSVRTAYGQFVFPGDLPSPWVFTSLLNDPLNALVMTGPIDIVGEVLPSDDFATLFKANATALVTLADRQSVSNIEARWESLKNTGWKIFNSVLPFMGGTVGAATWIWQLMDDLQQLVDAEEIGDRSLGLSAVVDILLTLGVVLTTHIVTRYRPEAPIKEPDTLPELPPPVVKPPLIQKPTIDAAQLPVGHEHTLHIDGALTRSALSLGVYLGGFAVPKPDLLGERHKLTGPHLNLYAKSNHWYAPVGERWFEVIVDENNEVLIIDPKQPGRYGPPLIGNRQGQWFIDTRLRLRGGGLRARRKKGEPLRPPKIADLREQLSTFDREHPQQHRKIDTLNEAIKAAPKDAKNAARAALLTQIDTQLEALDVPISQLKSLNMLDTVPNYQKDMAGYLRHQVLLTRVATAEQHAVFSEDMNTALSNNDILGNKPVALTTSFFRTQYAAAQSVIDRIEYLQARFKDARSLGEPGVELIQESEPRLPLNEVDDLKSFKITLGRFLCVKESGSATKAEAKEAVLTIIKAAELAVKTLKDTLSQGVVVPQEQLIETLDSLQDQFDRVDQNLVDLPAQFPDDLNKPDLENLRKQVDEFAQLTKKQLTTQLRQRKTQEPTPGPSRPPVGAKKKFIKTRFQGMLVGEEREKPADDGKLLVDVKEPLTGKVIATFHEKEPGVWVERKHVNTAPTHAQARDLAISINTGQELLDGVDTFITGQEAWARETRQLPVEIEERFHRHAAKLERASQDIEEALTLNNQTESSSPSAALTNRNLDTAIKKLYREGKRVKLEVLKRRPPEAAHVEILLREGAVTVNPPTGPRTKLKGRSMDFLQEYAVVDTKTKQTLWYAHFHYTTPTGSEEAYTAAHLKTQQQRRKGGRFEALSDIAVYRSEIGPQLARSLFLKAKPAAQTD
ncbi:dermonecrotic toxin domain-containing protein [Pseudomonas reactans]